MNKRKLQSALNMAYKLFNKFSEVCEHPGCEGGGCYFHEHICMDVDTVITNLEALLRELEE
jgi:hypothetical protein